MVGGELRWSVVPRLGWYFWMACTYSRWALVGPLNRGRPSDRSPGAPAVTPSIDLPMVLDRRLMLATGPPWPSGGRQPRRSSAGMQSTKANDCQSQYSTPSCLYLRTWELQSPCVMLIGSM